MSELVFIRYSVLRIFECDMSSRDKNVRRTPTSAGDGESTGSFQNHKRARSGAMAKKTAADLPGLGNLVPDPADYYPTGMLHVYSI